MLQMEELEADLLQEMECSRDGTTPDQKSAAMVEQLHVYEKLVHNLQKSVHQAEKEQHAHEQHQRETNEEIDELYRALRQQSEQLSEADRSLHTQQVSWHRRLCAREFVTTVNLWRCRALAMGFTRWLSRAFIQHGHRGAY